MAIADPLLSRFTQDLERLSEILEHHPIDTVRYAEIVGQEEVWSARLMSALLNAREIKSACLDARAFLYAERALYRK